MTRDDVREADLRALAGIRDTLALVDGYEDVPWGWESARRASRDARSLRLWCDGRLTRYITGCCFPATPEARYDDRLGWTVACPECGRTVRAETMAEAEDRWEALREARA